MKLRLGGLDRLPSHKTMKKLPIILCLFTALGCSKESEESGKVETPYIAFSTVMTRGSQVDTPLKLAQNGGASIWAVKHNPVWASAANADIINIIDGATLASVDGTGWSYGTPVAWEKNRYFSFFAYSPSGSATSMIKSTKSVPQITFTPKTTVADQLDLLISTPLFNHESSSYYGSKAVGLFFNHALSQVRFSANVVEMAAGGAQIYITEVTINNIYNTATTSLDTYPIVWSVDDTKKDSYTLTTASGLKDNTPLSKTLTQISADNGLLFLIPQSLARSLNNEVTLTIKYKVGNNTFSIEAPMPTGIEWQAGKAYNYQIEIDNTFRVTVEQIDWNIVLRPPFSID